MIPQVETAPTSRQIAGLIAHYETKLLVCALARAATRDEDERLMHLLLALGFAERVSVLRLHFDLREEN